MKLFKIQCSIAPRNKTEVEILSYLESLDKKIYANESHLVHQLIKIKKLLIDINKKHPTATDYRMTTDYWMEIPPNYSLSIYDYKDRRLASFNFIDITSEMAIEFDEITINSESKSDIMHALKYAHFTLKEGRNQDYIDVIINGFTASVDSEEGINQLETLYKEYELWKQKQ
jgi:hypothetical protein